MTLEQARVLRAALDAAIDRAEQTGSADVNLTGTLDAQLSQAIDTLQADIDAARPAP